MRKAFEVCAAELIRELSEERLERTERIAERKIREAKDFAAYSDEIIGRAMRDSQMLDTQIVTAHNECNCLE